MNKRLIIVSNRLPLTIEQNGREYTSRPSSGGLVSAVSTYLSNEGKEMFDEKLWAGVPGCSEKTWRSVVNDENTSDYDYLPVFVNARNYEAYYNGFSNSLLWPLFHYFPSFAEYKIADFEAYVEVNQLFADRLADQLKEATDIVWIHDYHLLPLAGQLRKKFPKLTIGLFLHIPFPSYEMFRMIPKEWQEELLSGMLGADLIGFHTMEYASYFESCVERVYKIVKNGSTILWKERQVKVEAFPISIDFALFNTAYDDERINQVKQTYLQLKGDKKMIFSVDRLDYTKGIQNRLKGYKTFLLQNPAYLNKVVFVLVIVPSRDAIRKYAERKRLIDEYISNLNSSIGTISWQPIIYHYNHLSFEELIALYTACDLALITPLRDGMNLVAKEFVASRKDQQGALVLSEMAGAAKELTEALLINPNDEAEIAAMIKYGLEMEKDEQMERMRAMQDHIRKYNVNTWASDFFEQINKVKVKQTEFDVKIMDRFAKASMLKHYASARRRLVLLDYDGTLVPFSKMPQLASPDAEILDVLHQISANEKNDVYVVSGRDSTTLGKWLGHLPLGLIAEHGAKVFEKNTGWKNEAGDELEKWMIPIKALMDKYVAKCPRSFIETKEFSLAWHYRNADIYSGVMRAKELYEQLLDYTAALPLSVLNGHKVIEVRSQAVNKGIAAGKILEKEHYDFILCIGDDQTDEDMFKALSGMSNVYTIKVGQDASFAKYNLQSPYVVRSLLQMMADYPEAI